MGIGLGHKVTSFDLLLGTKQAVTVLQQEGRGQSQVGHAVGDQDLKGLKRGSYLYGGVKLEGVMGG